MYIKLEFIKCNIAHVSSVPQILIFISCVWCIRINITSLLCTRCVEHSNIIVKQIMLLYWISFLKTKKKKKNMPKAKFINDKYILEQKKSDTNLN